MLIFRPKSNLLAKVLLLGFLGTIIATSLSAWGLKWSPYITLAGDYIEQPVPFSHSHHVGGLGLDCRYCHTSVEVSANAGFPPTHTCMTCHSQIWTNAPVLEPVRESLREERRIRWKRVYRIPDYVYFDHSIHVAKGVGCTTCHGQIDRMPLTSAAKPFYMQQCLDCHQNPENFVRPKEEVFSMDWRPPAQPQERRRQGLELIQKYKIAPAHKLTDCYVCHR